ncbi:MAG: hypothetical protein O7G87_06825 [bacterium]|nr:hypothetical protein [bacterium]
MKRIVIQTPGRLHFGLIDMNGEIGRIDGGIGLALDVPYTQIEAKRSDGVQVVCEEDEEIGDRLEHAVHAVCNAYDLPGASVAIQERPLAHVGLGSATQTLVGAAQAVCRLYELEKPVLELGRLVGRGGTSGIGIGAIESGGFIVDGGHRFRRGERARWRVRLLRLGL